MFKDKQEGMASGYDGNQTIIAQGVKVEGDFHSDGDVLIDGEVSGSLQTSKVLQIGKTARIQADVEAQSAIIAGEVQGNIQAIEKLELHATSVVHGDIVTGLISVAPGAKINGRISMKGVKTPDVVEEVFEEFEEEETDE